MAARTRCGPRRSPPAPTPRTSGARPARHYELCDTAPARSTAATPPSTPTSNAAVRATARQVLTYRGEVAFTQFSASNGGYTRARAPIPLPAREEGPLRRRYRGWKRTFTGNEIERALAVDRHLPLGGSRAETGTGRAAAGSRRLTGDRRGPDVNGEDFQVATSGCCSTLFKKRDQLR